MPPFLLSRSHALIISSLVDTASLSGGQQQEFLDAAKRFAAALGAVIEAATAKNMGAVVESLKEGAQVRATTCVSFCVCVCRCMWMCMCMCVCLRCKAQRLQLSFYSVAAHPCSPQALLTAAKTVFKAPNDKVAKESLDLARNKILLTLKELAPAPVAASLMPTPPQGIAGSRPSTSSLSTSTGSPLSAFPISQSASSSSLSGSIGTPPPAVEVHHNTPLPPPTAIPTAVLASPPPALPSPPPLSHKPLPTPPPKGGDLVAPPSHLLPPVSGALPVSAPREGC